MLFFDCSEKFVFDVFWVCWLRSCKMVWCLFLFCSNFKCFFCFLNCVILFVSILFIFCKFFILVMRIFCVEVIVICLKNGFNNFWFLEFCCFRLFGFIFIWCFCVNFGVRFCFILKFYCVVVIWILVKKILYIVI